MALVFPREPTPCSAWPVLFWPLFFAVVIWAHFGAQDRILGVHPEEMNQHNIRFLEVQGVLYLRAKDVKEYLLALAGGEETDVRNRISQAAENLAPSREERRPRSEAK